MRRRIHLGIAVLTLVSVGACSRSQDPQVTAQRILAPVQATLTAQGQEEHETLLEVAPPNARNLARLKVADAAAQPLFQAFMAELRQSPRLAQREQQIQAACGESPLQAIDEVLLFGAPDAAARRSPPGSPTRQRGEQTGQATQQPQLGAEHRQPRSVQRPEQRAQPSEHGQRGPAAEMLVQLNRPASWAFQCLSAMREDVSETLVGGRPARSIGQFVAVDAGNDRLLVARRQTAPAALQRLAQTARADAEPTHRAAQRVERLGDPLLFGTGMFAGRMGLESAETVLRQEGDALQLQMTGTMADAEAAETAAQQLQTGLAVLEAVLGNQLQPGQGQPPPQGGATEQGVEGQVMAERGTVEGAGQDDPRQILRSVIEGVRIESRGDTLRVGVNLPDADAQRFLGGALARFLAEGGAERLLQRQQQQRQPDPAQPRQEPSPGPTGSAAGSGN